MNVTDNTDENKDVETVGISELRMRNSETHCCLPGKARKKDLVQDKY